MTINGSPDEPGRYPYVYFLRLPEVRSRVCLSTSEIYRRVALGTFPSPVRLGARCSAWPEAEVSAWIAARIAERDGVAR